MTELDHIPWPILIPAILGVAMMIDKIRRRNRPPMTPAEEYRLAQRHRKVLGNAIAGTFLVILLLAILGCVYTFLIRPALAVELVLEVEQASGEIKTLSSTKETKFRPEGMDWSCSVIPKLHESMIKGATVATKTVAIMCAAIGGQRSAHSIQSVEFSSACNDFTTDAATLKSLTERVIRLHDIPKGKGSAKTATLRLFCRL